MLANVKEMTVPSPETTETPAPPVPAPADPTPKADSRVESLLQEAMLNIMANLRESIQEAAEEFVGGKVEFGLAPDSDEQDPFVQDAAENQLLSLTLKVMGQMHSAYQMQDKYVSFALAKASAGA